MRLIHLTDPHLSTPPDWRSLAGRSHFGKRYLGYASWFRKRRHQLRRAWLDEMTVEMAALNPDLVILTGDLTQIGTEEEIRQARDWLEGLGPAGRVAFVPGNHDTYAKDSWPVLQRELKDYLPADGAGYPLVRRLEDVAVIGLCSAEPTPPLSATGRLGADQLQRLEATLADHTEALKILYLHHPPLPGMIGWRKRLRDAPALSRLLERAPVELILHGHRHRDGVALSGATRVLATAPASARQGSLRVIDVDPAEGGWAVRVFRRQRAETGFETLEQADWLVSAPG